MFTLEEIYFYIIEKYPQLKSNKFYKKMNQSLVSDSDYLVINKVNIYLGTKEIRKEDFLKIILDKKKIQDNLYEEYLYINFTADKLEKVDIYFNYNLKHGYHRELIYEKNKINNQFRKIENKEFTLKISNNKLKLNLKPYFNYLKSINYENIELINIVIDLLENQNNEIYLVTDFLIKQIRDEFIIGLIGLIMSYCDSKSIDYLTILKYSGRIKNGYIQYIYAKNFLVNYSVYSQIEELRESLKNGYLPAYFTLLELEDNICSLKEITSNLEKSGYIQDSSEFEKKLESAIRKNKSIVSFNERLIYITHDVLDLESLVNRLIEVRKLKNRSFNFHAGVFLLASSKDQNIYLSNNQLIYINGSMSVKIFNDKELINVIQKKNFILKVKRAELKKFIGAYFKYIEKLDYHSPEIIKKFKKKFNIFKFNLYEITYELSNYMGDVILEGLLALIIHFTNIDFSIREKFFAKISLSENAYIKTFYALIYYNFLPHNKTMKLLKLNQSIKVGYLPAVFAYSNENKD